MPPLHGRGSVGRYREVPQIPNIRRRPFAPIDTTGQGKGLASLGRSLQQAGASIHAGAGGSGRGRGRRGGDADLFNANQRWLDFVYENEKLKDQFSDTLDPDTLPTATDKWNEGYFERAQSLIGDLRGMGLEEEDIAFFDNQAYELEQSTWKVLNTEVDTAEYNIGRSRFTNSVDETFAPQYLKIANRKDIDANEKSGLFDPLNEQLWQHLSLVPGMSPTEKEDYFTNVLVPNLHKGIVSALPERDRATLDQVNQGPLGFSGVAMPDFFSEKSVQTSSGVSPGMMEIARVAQKYLPDGWTFQVGEHGGARDAATQAALVAKGVSKTHKSKHLGREGGGLALDLVPHLNGRANETDMGFEIVSRAMKMASRELGTPVEWGGDWKGGWDKYHYQIDEAHSKVQPKDSTGMATQIISHFEGYRDNPYYDVNAYRAGYGSDTTTLADGTVVPIRQGMTVNREDSDRDLHRRITKEFMPRVKGLVGPTWGSLKPTTQAVLTSVAYNYGTPPGSVIKAAKTGSDVAVANAIESLDSSNPDPKIRAALKERRRKEAAIIRGEDMPAEYSPLRNSLWGLTTSETVTIAQQARQVQAGRYGEVASRSNNWAAYVEAGNPAQDAWNWYDSVKDFIPIDKQLQIEGRLDRAEGRGVLVNEMEFKSKTERQGIINFAKEISKSDPDNFNEHEQFVNDLTGVSNEIDSKLESDPASYAGEHPWVKEAFTNAIGGGTHLSSPHAEEAQTNISSFWSNEYYSRLYQTMQRLGLRDHEIADKLLTSQQRENILTTFRRLSRDTPLNADDPESLERLSTELEALKANTGEWFPLIAASLGDDLGSAMLAAADMDLFEQRTAKLDLLRTLDPEHFQNLKDNLGVSDESDIKTYDKFEDAVRLYLADDDSGFFKSTARAGDELGGQINKRAIDSVSRLALVYTQRAGGPTDANITKSIEKAFQDIFGKKYAFVGVDRDNVSPWFGTSNHTVRVPREKLGERAYFDYPSVGGLPSVSRLEYPVQFHANQIKQNLDQYDLYIENLHPDVVSSDEVRAQHIDSLKRYGTWVTAPNGAGLALTYEDGVYVTLRDPDNLDGGPGDIFVVPWDDLTSTNTPEYRGTPGDALQSFEAGIIESFTSDPMSVEEFSQVNEDDTFGIVGDIIESVRQGKVPVPVPRATPESMKKFIDGVKTFVGEITEEAGRSTTPPPSRQNIEYIADAFADANAYEGTPDQKSSVYEQLLKRRGYKGDLLKQRVQAYRKWLSGNHDTVPELVVPIPEDKIPK